MQQCGITMILFHVRTSHTQTLFVFVGLAPRCAEGLIAHIGPLLFDRSVFFGDFVASATKAQIVVGT